MNKNKSIFSLNLFNFTFHYLLWYFIFFSIAGLILETLYGYKTTGILESRKGLIWGPFCPIYGICAIILILLLYKYKNKILQLFLYGFIIGSILEYFLSYALESFYGTKFWDYSYLRYNLNGRISLLYSFFWGFLSVFLIQFFKPILDVLIGKLKFKLIKKLDFCILIFLILDTFFTIYALNLYKTNALIKYNNLHQPDYGIIRTFINNTFFSTNYVKKTFPNLRIINNYGKEIYIKNII